MIKFSLALLLTIFAAPSVSAATLSPYQRVDILCSLFGKCNQESRSPPRRFDTAPLPSHIAKR